LLNFSSISHTCNFRYNIACPHPISGNENKDVKLIVQQSLYEPLVIFRVSVKQAESFSSIHVAAVQWRDGSQLIDLSRNYETLSR